MARSAGDHGPHRQLGTDGLRASALAGWWSGVAARRSSATARPPRRKRYARYRQRQAPGRTAPAAARLDAVGVGDSVDPPGRYGGVHLAKTRPARTVTPQSERLLADGFPRAPRSTRPASRASRGVLRLGISRSILSGFPYGQARKSDFRRTAVALELLHDQNNSLIDDGNAQISSP